MELRERAGAGLRRAAGLRPGLVALCCGVYLVAALIATEPAIGHFGTQFMAGGAPGHGEAAPGDHLQTGWHLWLAGDQLGQGHVPWNDPYSFRPESGPSYNPAWWPFGLPYWPLVKLFGPVVAWNLFTLLCLVAGGLLAFLWLRELDLGDVAAAAGGLAFEIAPYRLAQSRGHLLGPISILLPLALWTFERARRTGRLRWWVLSWAALVTIPLSGQVHLALAAIPFYLLYAICRTRGRRPVLHASIGVVAALLAGLFVKMAVIDGSIDSGGRSLREVKVYSADGLDFVSRHARHGAEAFVFVGWLTPIVALLGFALLLYTRRYRLAVALGVGAFVPVFLAFGTNNPVYRALWHVFPPLRYPRVPERLLPVACLAGAALVAVAIDEALKRKAAKRVPLAVLAVVVAVVLVADLHVRAFHPSAADAANKAYAAVKNAPPGRLVELPVFLPDIHYGSTYLYYDQQVRRERPLGYSTTAPVRADVVARHLQPLSCGDWTTGAGARLAILKTAAITLHRGLYTDNPFVPNTAYMAWQGLVEHGWRPVVTDGAVTTFVRGRSSAAPPFPDPPHDGAIFCGGWFPSDELGHQMSESHSTLWLHGAGHAILVVGSPDPLTVRVLVDGRPVKTIHVTKLFPDSGTVVTLHGDRWHLVALETDRLPVIRGKPRGARVEGYVVP